MRENVRQQLSVTSPSGRAAELAELLRLPPVPEPLAPKPVTGYHPQAGGLVAVTAELALSPRKFQSQQIEAKIPAAMDAVGTTWTANACCGAMLGLLANASDIGPILGFLEDCHRLMPFILRTDDQGRAAPGDLEGAYNMLEELLTAGSLHMYFEPRVEIEQWIRSEADRFIACLKDHPAMKARDGAKLLRIVLGLYLVTSERGAEATEYFKLAGASTGPRPDQMGLVGTVARRITDSLFSTIVRDLFSQPEWEDRATALTTALVEFIDTGMRDRSKELTRSSLEPILLLYEKLRSAVAAQVFDELFLSCQGAALAQDTADVFQHTARAVDCSAQRPAMRSLPVGVLLIAERDPHDPELVVYYQADGLHHLGLIGVSDAREKHPQTGPYLREDAPNVWWEIDSPLAWCELDDHGKVFHLSSHRFAPPPLAQPDFELLTDVARNMDASFTRTATEWYQRCPLLFRDLVQLGPLMLMPSAEPPRLVCRRETSDTIAALIPGAVLESAEQTAALLADLKLTSSADCVSFAIPTRPAAEAQQTPAELPADEHYWESKLHEKLGSNFPGFRWAYKILRREFGVYHESTGVGSHGQLRRPGHPTAAGTFHWLRTTTESLKTHVLLRTLRDLGIPPADFYRAAFKEHGGRR